MKTITGNTYPVKDQLKALGARWNAAAKGWDVPEDKVEEAQKLVAAAPVSAPRPQSSRGTYYCYDCCGQVTPGSWCSEAEARHRGTQYCN